MNILNTVNLFPLYKINNVLNNQLRNAAVTAPAFKAKLEQDCFEPQKPKSLQTKYGTIHYLKDGRLCDLEFQKPLSFSEAMKCIKEAQNEYTMCTYGQAKYNYVYKLYDEAFSNKFKDMKFTRFLGAGNVAMALENEDGRVLKLSDKDQFYFRSQPEEFDAKIYRKGNVEKNYFYYLQEKCNKEGITEEHIEKMKKRIEKAGYEVFDLFADQLGFGKNGKLCLVDPECARDVEKYKKVCAQNTEWMQKYGLDIDYI